MHFKLKYVMNLRFGWFSYYVCMYVYGASNNYKHMLRTYGILLILLYYYILHIYVIALCSPIMLLVLF